jgi:hypothetical protein
VHARLLVGSCTFYLFLTAVSAFRLLMRWLVSG